MPYMYNKCDNSSDRATSACRSDRAARAIANPSGSTCYLGAAVQAIAHSAPFVRTLLTTPPVVCAGSSRGGDGGEAKIAAALRRLVTSMWARSGDALDPSALLAAVAPRLNRSGAGNALAQNDAHELITLVFDALVELRPEFRETLEGRLQQVVRCEVCGAETTRAEPFTVLPLFIPSAENDDATSVRGLLEAFFAPERIHGFHCDACGRKDASAARMMRMDSLPGVLVFCANRRAGRRVCRDVVRPDETLTFAIDARRSRAYRLNAVVCHSGNGAGGHYVTVARRPGSGAWDLHDDERVVGVGEARDVCPEFSRRSGYVYVYSQAQQ